MSFEISIFPGPTARSPRSSSLHVAQKLIRGPHMPPATRSRLLALTVTGWWVRVPRARSQFYKGKGFGARPPTVPVFVKLALNPTAGRRRSVRRNDERWIGGGRRAGRAHGALLRRLHASAGAVALPRRRRLSVPGLRRLRPLGQPARAPPPPRPPPLGVLLLPSARPRRARVAPRPQAPASDGAVQARRKRQA